MPEEVDSLINGIREGSFIKNAKHIVSDTPADYQYAKSINGFNGNETHFLNNGQRVEIDLSPYNNKIAPTSLAEKLYTIVIESEEPYQELSLMFDLARNKTKPLQ